MYQWKEALKSYEQAADTWTEYKEKEVECISLYTLYVHVCITVYFIDIIYVVCSDTGLVGVCVALGRM